MTREIEVRERHPGSGSRLPAEVDGDAALVGVDGAVVVALHGVQVAVKAPEIGAVRAVERLHLVELELDAAKVVGRQAIHRHFEADVECGVVRIGPYRPHRYRGGIFAQREPNDRVNALRADPFTRGDTRQVTPARDGANGGVLEL